MPKNIGNNRKQTGKSSKHIPNKSVVITFQLSPEPQNLGNYSSIIHHRKTHKLNRTHHPCLHSHPAKVNSIDSQRLMPQNIGNNRKQTGKSSTHIPKMSVTMTFQLNPEPHYLCSYSFTIHHRKTHKLNLAHHPCHHLHPAKVNSIDSQRLMPQNTGNNRKQTGKSNFINSCHQYNNFKSLTYG